MKKINRIEWSLAVFMVFFIHSSTLQAAGFYLSEVGTPGSLGTAGTANVTNTYTADASWANPAGMTGVKQDEILTGMQLLLPKMEFDSSIAEAGGSDGGNAGVAAAIPSFFMVKKLSDDARFGFSVVAPMGGGSDYGDDFVGRYGAYEVSLQGVGFSPSLAYQVNDKFSLGAGVSFVYTIFDEKIAVNQGAAPDGRVKIDGIDDWGAQFFAGITYEFNDQLLLGVVYRSEFDTELEGDVKFRDMLVTPPADSIDVDWQNPQLIEVGLRYELDDEYLLFASANWEDWSEFSDNRLAFDGGIINPVIKVDRNFKDTWHLGFGMAVRLDENRLFSLGASYDSSPVDDDDRTIDLPFDEQFKLSAAYGWKGDKKLDYAIGATLLYAGQAKVDQVAQGLRFKGEFDRNFFLFLGGTLRYVF